MQLTGKTEQQFKEWLYAKYQMTWWENLPEVCQLALMQEFFESISVYIYTRPYADEGHFVYLNDLPVWSIDRDVVFSTHSEALEAAITKANDINNGR